MSNKTSYISWILLILLIITSLWFKFYFCSNKSQVVINILDLSTNTPFINNISDKCPGDINVSDQFACIYSLASTTKFQADTLANKLITEAPIRLKQIQSSNDGPVSFEYGGSDFLGNLPELIKRTQKAKEEYVNNICALNSMKIFGGSGMDLEQNACIYYYNEQYLEILRGLESGVDNTN